jgi:adenylyltransferase/sulfurtransferase
MEANRHHRQQLLAQVGEAGQARLAGSRVLVVGCGALGSAVIDQLARAGVGMLRIVDRDVVDLTNLHRQTLYVESDARAHLAKVEAAARRVGNINRDVRVEPLAIDLDAGNVDALLDVDLVIDGTDNAQTRYLLNDACVRRGVAWVMGAALGTEGRAMLIEPAGPCLRCIWPVAPDPGELATCDSAGVLPSCPALVAAAQASMAMRWLVDRTSSRQLLTIEAWTMRFRTIALDDAKRPDCPCCGMRRFEFLNAAADASAKLCGRNAVQVRGPAGRRIDLRVVASRLERSASLVPSELMLRLVLNDRPDLAVSVFADGRMLVFGTEDRALARTLYARVVGV